MKKIAARQAVKNFRSVGEPAQWSFPGEEAATLGYEQASGEMAANRVFREFAPKIFPNCSVTKSVFSRVCVARRQAPSGARTMRSMALSPSNSAMSAMTSATSV